MGILANNFRDSLGVVQHFGATTITDSGNGAHRPQNFWRTGAVRNITAGEGIASDLAGLPDGNRHPNSWCMPQKGGALASRNIIEGAGAFASAGTMGVNGEATLAGAGDLAGVGQLIISMVAALTGSGTISSASADAFLQLAASLAGSGDLSGALVAIAHAAAALEGEGDVAGTATALGTLAAAIIVTGDVLNTANVGASVWGALAAANNAAATMGEKMNDAGSASNPWTEVIESGLTAAEILKLIAAAVQGNATGLENGSPVFKSIDGTIDRITATYATGTRTVTNRDAS